MSDKLPTLDEAITDNSKNPVRVTASLYDGNASEMNTIWAEKADYLAEVGEGLKNVKALRTDEHGHIIVPYDTTKILTLAPATRETLGGIKLSKNIDENGNITIFRDEYLATSTQPGFVKPSNNFNITEDGLLDYDPYVLPTANATTLGGVKIVNTYEVESVKDEALHKETVNTNLRMVGPTSQYMRVYTDFIRTSGLVSATDIANAGDSAFGLDTALNVLLQTIKNSFKEIDEMKNRVSVYIDGAATAVGSLITGRGTFMGTTTTVNLGTTLTDNNYHVALCQLSTTLGDVGEISVAAKTTSSFTVYNTGNNNFDMFVFVVVPSDVRFVSELEVPEDGVTMVKQLPIKRGSAMFNGETGTTVQLDGDLTAVMPNGLISVPESQFGVNANGTTPFADENYAVIITPSKPIEPTTDNRGKVGEYWVENKTSATFVVKCTGADSKDIAFDWIAIPYGEGDVDESNDRNYDRVVFPIRCGSLTAEEDICEVQMSENVYFDKQYLVLGQLTSNKQGTMGEYCVNEITKTRSGFGFKRSGSAVNYGMDWITIDSKN